MISRLPLPGIILFLVALARQTSTTEAFHGVLFPESPIASLARRRTVSGEAPAASPPTTADEPSATAHIDLPDFDELFLRIQTVSPLARQVIANHQSRGTNIKGPTGFDALDEAFCSSGASFPELPWKVVESNPSKLVHRIDKIDNFQGHPAPLLRFRSSFRGPCLGECFGSFIMDVDQRRLWDTQIDQVYERHPIHDLDAANIAMGFGKYGDCSRMGVGYCQTKPTLNMISSREQLTLCGIQDFADGSCVIWGVEMPDRYDDALLPPGPRHVRAKSHLFATTLAPTSDSTFDVEYVLQLEIGGKIPSWLTGPVVTENVKQLFLTANQFFAGSTRETASSNDRDESSALHRFLREKEQRDAFQGRHSILMTF